MYIWLVKKIIEAVLSSKIMHHKYIHTMQETISNNICSKSKEKNSDMQKTEKDPM